MLMHEVHGAALQQVAPALGIPLTEGEGLLASARRRVRPADNTTH
jgi:DNA-directed RNA polymerase specialized sigma24 family protein